jgi:ankyrin repeat protein
MNPPPQMSRAPIDYAARAGHKDIISELLKRGARVDIADEDGRTPLHWAAIKGKNDACIVLIGQGRCNVNAGARDGCTPLHEAARSFRVGNKDTVACLLQRGARVNAQSRTGQTALHLSATVGNVECIELLLACGAGINVTTKIGNSPLHEAAKAGYDDVVACLLENGARPGITNHEHDTALDVAVKNGHTHMHELLIECNDAAGMHRAPSN